MSRPQGRKVCRGNSIARSTTDSTSVCRLRDGSLGSADFNKAAFPFSGPRYLHSLPRSYSVAYSAIARIRCSDQWAEELQAFEISSARNVAGK